MASIRDQRARGRGIEVRWRDPDGKERTRSVPNLRAAKALAREVEDAAALGRRWQPRELGGVPTISDVLAAFIRARSRSKEASTVHHDAVTGDLFLRFLDARKTKDAPITEMSRALIEDFYDHLTRTPGKNKTQPPGEVTIQKYIRRIERAWNWAADQDEYEAYVPRPRKMELRSVVEQPVVAPTWQEMDACITAAAGWVKRVLIVQRYTGLRVQQVMALRWSDFDLDTATLTVRGELGKSREEKRGRVVPISPHLVEELAKWGRREGWVILTTRTGAQSRNMRARDVCRAWARAGIKPEVWEQRPTHAFRKGFVSGLKALGADIDAIEVLVGHKLPGQRSTYTDPSSIPMRAAVALLPKVGVQPLGEPLKLDWLRSSRR